MWVLQMFGLRSASSRRRGTRQGATMKGESLASRLDRLSDYIPIAGCKIWLGSVSANGYGTIMDGQIQLSAHRVAWTQTHGPIPAGMCILHKCDVPCCINPNHLFLGTHKDNTRDCMKKGRHAFGSKHGMTSLTKDDVLRIRMDRRPQGTIARDFGVHRTTVNTIQTGKHWRWLRDDCTG